MSTIASSSVYVEECFGTCSGTLLREEEHLVRNAAEVRRTEFGCGRTLARNALRRMGIEGIPILKGPSREPIWPSDIVGSITHCDGYCAAATAFATDILTLGIDAEVNEPLPPDILRMVAFGSDLEWVHGLPKNSIAWDRLLFSIKETVYKAWYPIEKSWLDFREVMVRVDPAARIFSAEVRSNRGTLGEFPSNVTGQYVTSKNYLLTSLELSRSRGSENNRDTPDKGYMRM